VSITHSERNIWSRTMFMSHHFQSHYQNCERASTPQSGTSHESCLRGFGGNGSIAWTTAVSRVGRASNAFKVTLKPQTFLPQPLYPGKDPVPTVQEARWAPGPVWMGAENLDTTGVRSPDRPAHSDFVYNLRILPQAA
jgi:hypothetical protein